MLHVPTDQRHSEPKVELPLPVLRQRPLPGHPVRHCVREGPVLTRRSVEKRHTEICKRTQPRLAIRAFELCKQQTLPVTSFVLVCCSPFFSLCSLLLTKIFCKYMYIICVDTLTLVISLRGASISLGLIFEPPLETYVSLSFNHFRFSGSY